MPSVTLMHPAKAVGRNEMPFGTDTRVAPNNIVLDKSSPGLPREGEFWGRNSQFAVIPPIAKLLIVYRPSAQIAIQSPVLAIVGMSVRLSVCPSICMSVIHWHCVKKTQATSKPSPTVRRIAQRL